MKLSEREGELEDAKRELESLKEAVQQKTKKILSLESELELRGKDETEMIEGYKAKIEEELREQIQNSSKEVEQMVSSSTPKRSRNITIQYNTIQNPKQKEEMTNAKKRAEQLEEELKKTQEELKNSEESLKESSNRITALQRLFLLLTF